VGDLIYMALYLRPANACEGNQKRARSLKENFIKRSHCLEFEL
jgi:hypothetical protein